MKRFVIAEMDEDLTRDLLKEFHSAGEIEIVKWYTTEENQKYFYDLPAAERFVQTWRKGLSEGEFCTRYRVLSLTIL